MKIYVQENGWTGCIVVIANSRQEALEMMSDELNFDNRCKPEDLLEFEIQHGWKYCNLGDM